MEEQTNIPETNEEKKNQPIKKYVTKGGVSAVIWSKIEEVNGKQIEMFNITVERSYTKDDGKTWESTNSMRVDDLPKVALVCEQAYKFITLKQMGNRN